ncbi:MAG TPA: hypothetical protein PKY84_05390, partial [Thermosynergistes sp.]|nr:hypothetical protein [Thermosynergistes sp.]
NIRLLTPPLREQEKIAAFLDEKTFEIDFTIQKLQKNIKLFKEYKKSLIHHVVTGKRSELYNHKSNFDFWSRPSLVGLGGG